jgi:hypothetical protein
MRGKRREMLRAAGGTAVGIANQKPVPRIVDDAIVGIVGGGAFEELVGGELAEVADVEEEAPVQADFVDAFPTA